MKKYIQIVFQHGEDASETLEIITMRGVVAAVGHLRQWETGDESDILGYSAAGRCDVTNIVNGYLLSYNLGLGYVGLQRVIEDEVETDDESEAA